MIFEWPTLLKTGAEKCQILSFGAFFWWSPWRVHHSVLSTSPPRFPLLLSSLPQLVAQRGPHRDRRKFQNSLGELCLPVECEPGVFSGFKEFTSGTSHVEVWQTCEARFRLITFTVLFWDLCRQVFFLFVSIAAPECEEDWNATARGRRIVLHLSATGKFFRSDSTRWSVTDLFNGALFSLNSAVPCRRLIFIFRTFGDTFPHLVPSWWETTEVVQTPRVTEKPISTCCFSSRPHPEINAFKPNKIDLEQRNCLCIYVGSSEFYWDLLN